MCQKNLNTVDTIEGFWQVFNHIERPSRINLGCDYCFFKASAKDIGVFFPKFSYYRKESNRIGLTSKTSMGVAGLSSGKIRTSATRTT